MDKVSFVKMKNFRSRYLRGMKNLSVCDVGSLDVNGSYRFIFLDHRYTGVDIAPGPNVDVVTEPYTYPFRDEAFDVVISGGTIEHVFDMFRWIVELKRILKKDGWMCIIAPSLHGHHAYPVDCWRIYPDGMKFLLGEVAGLEVHKAVQHTSIKGEVSCIGVGRRL